MLVVFLQRRLTMAGALHFILLLFLHYGSFVLISARPADDTAAVRSTVDPDAALTPTVSLSFAGKTTNTTDVPTTGFTTSKSTTKPPTTTTETGKTAERAAPRKEAEEEEEGPLELGEWISINYFNHLLSFLFYIFKSLICPKTFNTPLRMQFLMCVIRLLLTHCSLVSCVFAFQKQL